jgi:hypothetical protein
MHHSNDPDREALVVTCYLDESATDGSTPTAVVGGLLVNSSHFLGLDKDGMRCSMSSNYGPVFT